MAKREFSAGGIVVKKRFNNFEILLIKDSYGRWTWPKGHIDQGEKSHQTALREISEETGLKEIKILNKIGRTNYSFHLKGELIFKTVFFFLAVATGDEKFRIQQDEIKEAKWFTPKKALETVTYKGAKKMLEKAIKMYEKEKRNV